MNDATLQGPVRKKRAYEKPQMVQVPLRANEAVLGHCKTSSQTGPGATSAQACHPIGNCFSIGS
jgi:hypothetical protein